MCLLLKLKLQEYTSKMIDDEYEQQLEAESEGMVGNDFTWEEYEEWKNEYSKDDPYDDYCMPEVRHIPYIPDTVKKDHSDFIRKVENNELGTDEILKYLNESTRASFKLKEQIRYGELSKDDIVKQLKETL